MAEGRSITPVEIETTMTKSRGSSKRKPEMNSKAPIGDTPTDCKIAVSSGQTIHVRSKELFQDNDPKPNVPQVFETAITPSLPHEPFQVDEEDKLLAYGTGNEKDEKERPLKKISGAFEKLFRKRAGSKKKLGMERSSSADLAEHVSELPDRGKSNRNQNIPTLEEDLETSPSTKSEPKLENTENNNAEEAEGFTMIPTLIVTDHTDENVAKQLDENDEIACPFGDLGCTKKGRVTDIKQHMKTSSEAHLINICNSVKQLSDVIGEVEEACKVSFREINDCIHRMKVIDSLFSGQFIWRVSNYQEAFDRARCGIQPVIYSRVFYSHRNGYKLAIALAPFGDGDSLHRNGFAAVGTTNSVFLTILRGPHDGILPWPFVCPVTFTMINQKRKGEDISLSLTPKVNENNEVFIGKPVSARNPAFGLRSFVDLKVMQADGNFVVDNSCFIRVDVDLSSVPNEVIE